MMFNMHDAITRGYRLAGELNGLNIYECRPNLAGAITLNTVYCPYCEASCLGGGITFPGGHWHYIVYTCGVYTASDGDNVLGVSEQSVGCRLITDVNSTEDDVI